MKAITCRNGLPDSFPRPDPAAAARVAQDQGPDPGAAWKLLGIGQVRIAEIERDPSVVSVAQLFKLLTALDAHIVLRDSRPDDAAKPDTTPKGSW